MCTYERVVKAIAEALNISPTVISPSSTLTELGADSLGMVELVMTLEEEFGSIEPEDMLPDVSEPRKEIGDMTVQEIVDAIDQRLT